MSKARITYRFDQETQLKPLEAEFIQRDQNSNAASDASKVIPLYQEDPAFTAHNHAAWRSPFDAETERIEQLIRNSEMRKEEHIAPSVVDRGTPAFYTAPQAEESFQDVNFYNELPVRAIYRRREKNSNWFSITTSITGAILTGILLGMFVLSMFNGEANPLPDSESPTATDDGLSAVLNSAEQLLDDTNKEDATNNVMNEIPTLIEAVIPEQAYYLIQNGVFSSLEGANVAVQLLKDEGLSGAVSQGDQFNVFAGAAATHEDALLLSHNLQNNNLEVFVKTFTIPAVEQMVWAGKNGDQIQGYVEEGRSLVKSILKITSLALNKANSPVSDSEKKLTQQQHKLWTDAANKLATDASDETKALVEQMNKSLNSAILTMEQYNKNPSDVYLWQAQAAVAEHIIAQKQFIEATKMQ
jgi:stage II sporulation protein B